MWLWQHPDWPNFSYNHSEIEPLSNSFRYASGLLSGAVGQMGDSDQVDAHIDIMVLESQLNSEIEGLKLKTDDLYSSIINQLGRESMRRSVSDSRANGIGKLTIEARTIYNKPLSKKLLCDWQKLIVPPMDGLVSGKVVPGVYRTDDVAVVSGALQNRKVHFEAVPHGVVEKDMARFINWFNETHPLNSDRKYFLPGIARSAIAHLYFETIHPFSDGNGRIGRAVAEMALSQEQGSPVLLSLSEAIAKGQSEYYRQLKKFQKDPQNMDVTDFVRYWADVVIEAQHLAESRIEYALKKARYFRIHDLSVLPQDTQKTVQKILALGPDAYPDGISASKYASHGKVSKPTATRHLTNLVDRGFFSRSGAGRSVRYHPNLPDIKILKLESVPERRQPQYLDIDESSPEDTFEP